MEFHNSVFKCYDLRYREKGGNRTISRSVNDSFYLDVDNTEWKNVNLVAEENSKTVVAPKQREQPAIFYDSGE